MRKLKIDDDFQAYLVEGATFVGEAGIPMLMDTDDATLPKSLVSFPKCRRVEDRRKYVHFYVHDCCFSKILTDTRRFLPLLHSFDGVITPDPSILIGRSRCLQETNVFFSRAVGFYLQKNGIPVIPNVRWGDDSTYSFCFLGVPEGSIVAVSTLGAIRRDRKTDSNLRKCFADGLGEMLRVIKPKAVVVYGCMPEDIFGTYRNLTTFVRYPSEIELAHGEEK